jgi:hydrogenase/urease accessory protein HupE
MREFSMNLRIKQASILTFFCLLLAPVLRAHPIPDIPVRTFFPGDGTARVTVEVDPRCFDEDPAVASSLLQWAYAPMSAEDRRDLVQKADELVRRCIEFTIEPVGKVQPEFKFTFTGHSGEPLKGPEDVVVLTGEWRTTLASGLSGWHIRSTEKSKLSVVFQNIIRGRVHERLAVLFPGEKSFSLDLAGLATTPAASAGDRVPAEGSSGDRWSTFVAYLRQGFVHVVPEGLDHILFVLGLFLLSRKWKPLLAQVTTFTLAHSVTLALATLGMVKVSPTVVEPIIAASIAFVALENIFRPRYTHWRLLVVFVFGLIHGLGFASALSDLELPRNSLAVGLVGFNVGVEGGQLAVISVAFLLTGWLRDAARYRRWIVIPGSAMIALCGVWWTIQRIAGA